MRTKDGYLIHVGMWVYDQNGIYEIKEIRPTSILVNEIGFDCPDHDTSSVCDTCGNSDTRGNSDTNSVCDTCGNNDCNSRHCPCPDFWCYSDTYTLLPQEIRRLHYA